MEIATTTIGTSGVTFLSVSAGNGVSGPARGIVLNGAGSNGFTITGSGTTNGSGGIIQDISQRGIVIINTNNISLSNVILDDASTTSSSSCGTLNNSDCFAAIHMINVSTVTLKNVVIDNYIFGVASVNEDGYESPVVFPGPIGAFWE